MEIKWENEPLKNLNKVTGDFKPIFGSGTGAGDIKCPKCFRELGHATTIDADLWNHLDDLKNTEIRGHINTSYHCDDCELRDQIPDLSGVQVRDLLIGVRPMKMDHYTYVTKITGPGMKYDPDLGWHEDSWKLDDYKWMVKRRQREGEAL